jgi:hypothetical protein
VSSLTREIICFYLTGEERGGKQGRQEAEFLEQGFGFQKLSYFSLDALGEFDRLLCFG